MSALPFSRRPERLECRCLLTGTPQLVADLATAPVVDLSGSFVDGDLLYFYASQNATGRELWQSDGKVPGTHLVADFAQGPDDATAELWGRIDDRRLFLVHDDGLGGDHLYVVDETSSEPTLLADEVTRHVGGSDRSHFFIKSQFELWVTDGTSEGTFPVYNTADVHEAVYSQQNNGVLLRDVNGSLIRVDEANNVELLRERYIPRPIGTTRSFHSARSERMAVRWRGPRSQQSLVH